MKTDIIIDCDPGQDDAIAILMAINSQNLNILGITTVAGNVNGEQTYLNAMNICGFANRANIGVYKGALKPLQKDIIFATHIHGENGLSDNIKGEYLDKKDIDAVEFLIKTLRESSKKITIAATAALTNIALAIRQAPDIKEKIEKIVLMGGSVTEGNITKFAEFNFFTDPHAAKEVFESGLNIVMIGLNSTNQTMFDEQLINRVKQIGNKVSDGIVNIMQDLLLTYREVYNIPGAIIHDGCVMAYLNDPSIFATKPALVKIETEDQEKIGASYVTFGENIKPNATVTLDVNVSRLFDMMIDLLSAS